MMMKEGIRTKGTTMMKCKVRVKRAARWIRVKQTSRGCAGQTEGNRYRTNIVTLLSLLPGY